MKSCLALVALATAATALPAAYVQENHALLWANFKAEHGKTYNATEEPMRASIFLQNMLRAAAMEAAHPEARFGATKFADLTAEEFKVYHSQSIPTREAVHTHFEGAELAELKGESVDWRTKNAVTHVKDQGQCGSCWAFSSTGGIEGAHAIAAGKLTSVSEQELVACDHVDGGCMGGLMQNAFTWLVDKKKGQIVTEKAYPYTSAGGDSGKCKDLSSMAVGATIKGQKVVSSSPSTEDQMAAYLVKHGPISIAVDAAGSWQMYTGGVLSGSLCKGHTLDHGVLAVGVTEKYWIVKNSWGASWGESGYIRLERGVACCLLTNNAVVPLV